MIEVLAGILLPVFMLTAIGYAWAKLGMPLDRDFVTRLVMNVATPCLIVDSVSKLGLPITEFATMILSALVMLAAAAAAGAVILRLTGLSQRAFLPALTFGNAGNIGLPLSYFAFGDAGLGLSAGVFLTAVVVQFTLAPALLDRRPALQALVSTPVVYAAIIGLGLLAGGMALPGWLDTTIGLLADTAIPLSLLILGFALAELRVQRAPVAVGLGIARILVGFAVAGGVAALFGMTGIARSVLVLHGGMPSAIVCYLFAARYECNPDEVAGVVLVSTCAAALLLPLLVSYVLWLNGSLPT